MKRTIRKALPVVLLMLASVASAGDTAPDKAPEFTLEDQHKKTHAFKYPRDKPLVLVIGDPGGSKDAPNWANTINAKYGDRIEFWRMGNLSFIPALGRGAARLGIRATSKLPVLCDWDSSISAKLGAPKGQANVIVISPEGEIVHRSSGKVEPPKLAAVFNIIDDLLPRSDASPEESAPEQS